MSVSKVTHSIELQPLSGSHHQPTDQARGEECYDVGRWTYRICLVNLALSWVAGIACVIVAAAVGTAGRGKQSSQDSDSYPQTTEHVWPKLDLSSEMVELVRLVFNFVLTVLVEGMGLVHAVTLRWALGDRLTFSSNLRLFACARATLALGPWANTVHAISLILSYAAIAFVFATEPSAEFCRSTGAGDDECLGRVFLSPPALGLLGGAILVQAAFTTWQMLAVKVPTWSASPLDTAWASASLGLRTRRLGRCMMGVHDLNTPVEPRVARTRQRSAWTAHKEVRRIVLYIWILTVACFIWFVALFAITHYKLRWIIKTQVHCNGCGLYEGSNWNPIPDYGGSATSAALIAEYSAYLYAGMFVIVYLFQAFLTMALHCTELITTLARDEVSWRQCYTQRPYKPRPTAVVRAMLSWSAVLLFLLKAVLHWLFGNGMTYAYNWGVLMRAPQLMYLSLGTMVLAGFATLIANQRPTGPQPATYGHVQTMVDLVDDWHINMYWGDKGLSEGGGGEVRHAGTAAHPLAEIDGSTMYAGKDT